MKRFFVFFILPILFMTSCSGPFNPFAESAGKEIFPPLEHQRWVYKVANINSASYNNVAYVDYWYDGKIESYWGDSLLVLCKNSTDSLGNTIWSYNDIYYAIDDLGEQKYLLHPWLHKKMQCHGNRFRYFNISILLLTSFSPILPFMKYSPAE
ncbi:MAG: hypothetical protein AB7T10_00020 [bacterium]